MIASTALSFATWAFCGAHALNAAAKKPVRTNSARRLIRIDSITVALPCESQVFEVRAEVGIGIDLGHRQRGRWRRIVRRHLQPGFGVHALLVPVYEVALAYAHDGAGQHRRFR